ncbi:MAG TPA: hypothetical protein VHA14_03490, partial [Bryobacteraceae bacterium]|nr:hypothetical protein [Bryobacteraceae bacterium]
PAPADDPPFMRRAPYLAGPILQQEGCFPTKQFSGRQEKGSPVHKEGLDLSPWVQSLLFSS